MGLLDRINQTVEFPLRYIGKEFGVNIKKNYKASILFAFPDLYEIGMSHYGTRLLYDIVNSKTEHMADRVYMPWKDVYKILKDKKILLSSIERDYKFKDFDAVGFSLEHELSYTNAIAMLELGGLDAFADKRKENTIVIAGGSGVYNPYPVVDFFDVFFIGEAEEAIVKFLDILAKIKNKRERLEIIASLPGFFVPSIHGYNTVIKRQFLDRLDSRAEIENYITPLMDIVHNRLTYEIQRGCNRSCRFCQAGIIYRPVRQRAISDLIRQIDRDLKKTGYKELGFLSLNAGDYKEIQDLLLWVYNKYRKEGVRVSLPSLRIESLNDKFLQVFSNVPKGGFTIAPETASERLKLVINKNISNDEIIETARKANVYGWKNIKAYFMTGLPTETDEDLYAIKDLAYSMRKAIKHGTLTINVSNFIPKPHTPFQWVGQLSGEEFYNKLSILKHELRYPGIKLRWHDPFLSEIEGVLSRGDRKLSKLLYAVYKRGEIFTAWAGEFHYNVWLEEARKLSIDFKLYLKDKNIDDKLVWDSISVDLSKQWLKDEYLKAQKGELTEDCLDGSCSACGVCRGKIHNVVAKHENLQAEFIKDTLDFHLKYKRYRIRFTKYGELKWLSHLELMDLIKKLLARASVPLSISNGYKAEPILSFSPPTPDKIESFAEYIDVFTYKEIDILSFLKRFEIEGIKFISAQSIDIKAPSVQSSIDSILWCAKFKANELKISQDSKTFIKEYDIPETDFIELKRKNKYRKVYVKDFVRDIRFTIVKDNCFINFKTVYTDGRTIKPLEVLKYLSNSDLSRVGREIRVKKLKVLFR